MRFRTSRRMNDRSSSAASSNSPFFADIAAPVQNKVRRRDAAARHGRNMRDLIEQSRVAQEPDDAQVVERRAKTASRQRQSETAHLIESRNEVYLADMLCRDAFILVGIN